MFAFHSWLHVRGIVSCKRLHLRCGNLPVDEGRTSTEKALSPGIGPPRALNRNLQMGGLNIHRESSRECGGLERTCPKHPSILSRRYVASLEGEIAGFHESPTAYNQ